MMLMIMLMIGGGGGQGHKWDIAVWDRDETETSGY